MSSKVATPKTAGRAADRWRDKPHRDRENTALPLDSRRLESSVEEMKLAENGEKIGFTIYLDGHAGHQGNVLAHSFLNKVRSLILVLNKLERAYINSPVRQTDFEIVDADKFNPTTLSLKPVPRAKAYDPVPTLGWSLEQIGSVGRGAEPDARVSSEIAYDLVKLATKESETGYRAFWINGYADPVRFDDGFRENAINVARARARRETPTRWRVGTSQGTVVGELKKVDDLEAENEFVIVPPVGAKRVVCTFPEAMRAQMGEYLFKIVRVTGHLHYGEEGPFPYKVDASSIVPMPKRRKSLSDMRGIFAGKEQVPTDWETLLNG